MSQSDLSHYEKIAIASASQKMIDLVAKEVLEAIFSDGVTDLNALTGEQYEKICEKMAIEGRMIEAGQKFLLDYADEMKAQISRNDAPF